MKNLWEKLDVILKILVVTSVFCLIFVLGHKAILDLDIWLHLKTGEFIAQNKIVPQQDIFSFTFSGKQWVDHEWLFQLLVYLIYNKWQADGLISLKAFVITLSFLVLFLMRYKDTKIYIEMAVFLLLIAYSSLSRFNIRPDIFSLLFFAIYLNILRFHINKKFIWALLPIQILWVNFHGYFFLGPLLVFLFIIAEFLRRRLTSLPWSWKEEFILTDLTYMRLKRIFIVVVLACFINPNGLKGFLYPIDIFKDILFGKTQVFFRYIEELQPTLSSFGSNFGSSFYYIIAAFCMLFMAINFKKLKVIEIVISVFFFLFSLKLRQIAFFPFVAYMIIISYVDQSIMKISTKIKLEAPFKQKLSYLLNYAISVVLIIWLGSRINMVLSNYYYDLESNKLKSSLSGLDPKSYPEKAVDFILKNKVSSNMFNDFNSGAYLIGRAYPERRVFIDGRTEIYGDKFFHQYIDILNGDAVAFEKMVDSYQIGAILFNMISNPLPKIITYIHKDPRWQLVYLDDSAVVFLRDIPSNKELIKNYEIDLKKYSPPIVDLKILGLRRVYPSPYIKRANLFNVLEEDSLVIAEAKEALRMMPASSEAYHFLGKAYLRKKLYEEALEHLRSAILLSPGNAEMLVDLGVCLKELKENESAIHALQGAIKYSPRNALAYYQLGSVFLAIKDETKAIQALNKAIEYAPQNARCYLKLAEAFYEKGKRLKENTFLEKAREEANKALRLSEQDKELRKEIEDKLKEIVDKK